VSEAFAPRDDATRRKWRERLDLQEPLIVLNVKRLHPLAGQRYLIDAFAAVARGRTDMRLVIGGAGELRGALARQALAAGVGDLVTFPGLLANEDVARYMAVADVFALPSLLEALPTVAVEALASGTPVISADHPGGVELAAIFPDDVVVVPRENADALAAALRVFLARPHRVRAETLERLAARFRPAAVLENFDAVYAQAKRR
jgi:glycosyltransferase involved in cell wall biosynthesis